MTEQVVEDNAAVIAAEKIAVGGIPDLSSVLDTFQEHWLGSFLLNLLGYALIILPAALLIRRWKKDPAVQSGENLIHIYVCTHDCHTIIMSMFIHLSICILFTY